MSQKKPPPSYESVLLNEWGAKGVLEKKKDEKRKEQNQASEGEKTPTVHNEFTTTPEPLYEKMSPQEGNLDGYVSQDELFPHVTSEAQSPPAGAGQTVGVYKTTTPKPQSRAEGSVGQGGIVDSSEPLYATISESEVNKGESDKTRAKGALSNPGNEKQPGGQVDPLYAEIQNKSLWQRLKEIFSNAVEWIREKWSSVTGKNKSVEPVGASSFQNPIYGESPSLHETKSRTNGIANGRAESITSKTPTGRNRGATEPLYAVPKPVGSSAIKNQVYEAASAPPNSYGLLSGQREGVSQTEYAVYNQLDRPTAAAQAASEAAQAAASATASQNSSDGISAAQSDAQKSDSASRISRTAPPEPPPQRTKASAASEAAQAAGRESRKQALSDTIMQLGEGVTQAATKASSARVVRPADGGQDGIASVASSATQGPDVSPTAGAGGRDGGARNNSTVSGYTAPQAVSPRAGAGEQVDDKEYLEVTEVEFRDQNAEASAQRQAAEKLDSTNTFSPEAQAAAKASSARAVRPGDRKQTGYQDAPAFNSNPSSTVSERREVREREQAQNITDSRNQAQGDRRTYSRGNHRDTSYSSEILRDRPATVDMARLESENSPLLKCLEDFVAKGRWPENYSTSSTEEFVQQIHQESGGLVRKLVQGGFLTDDTSVYKTLKSQGGRKIYPLNLEGLEGKRIFMPKFDKYGKNMLDADGNQIMDVLTIGKKADGGIGVIDGIIMPPPDSSSISQELIDDLQLAHGIKRSLEDVQKQAIDIVATPLIWSAQSIGGTPPMPGRSTQQQINTGIDREYAEQYRKAAIYDLANREANPTMRGVEPTPDVIDRTLAFMVHLGGDQESLKKLELQTTELAKDLNAVPPKTKEPKFQQDYANFCADAHQHVAAYHQLQENRFRQLADSNKLMNDPEYWKKCAELAEKLKNRSLEDARVNQAIGESLGKNAQKTRAKPVVKTPQRSPTNT